MKSLVALLVLPSVCGAQLIVVSDGNDLVAAVAAAPDGATVEIQSDQTFDGAVTFDGKALTIRAGAGFAPTIRGLGTTPAVDLTGPFFTSDDTTATFEGIRFESAAGTRRGCGRLPR